MAKTEDSKNVLGTTEFKSKDDWVNQLINKNCVDENVGAVEAVAEVKNDKGKVTTAGVRAKKGKDALNTDRLIALAKENNLTPREGGYANPGMWRMNIGNMLRAAAKKRHGLYVNGVFKKAPDDYPVNEEKTENKDGEKIAKKKEKAA